MAKSAAALLSLFLTLNLLFITGVSSAASTNDLLPPLKGECPKRALELGVCAVLLKDLLRLVVGSPATMPCCSLISGLVDLEAAACLCTVLNANTIGIKFDNIPASLNLLINVCGKSVPIGYQCK